MALSLVIAIGIWWSANTVSHQFIHRPFFRRPWANACAGRGLTLVTGVPQSLWRDRHLAHHAGARAAPRPSASLAIDAALVLGLWTMLALRAPAFFAWTYAPGYAAAMLLCAIHGRYEHAAGGPISHYGRLYNALCFNDGYHAEHHRYPGVHWTRLPELRDANARSSSWPAPLRWLDALSRAALGGLERIVLHSPLLQRAIVRVHADAFAALAPELRAAARIAIVGGGLFPRTALVLKRLAPAARVTIVDASRANLERARARLADDRVTFVHARFSTLDPSAFDLVIIPLSFDGDRGAIYAHPPAALVIVHDWIWRKRGDSRVVSFALLKRLNVVRA